MLIHEKLNIINQNNLYSMGKLTAGTNATVYLNTDRDVALQRLYINYLFLQKNLI